MNCAEFQAEFDQSVESRLPLTAELRSHAETCSSSACRDRLTEHLLLEQAIVSWKSHVLKVNVADSIVSQVTSDSTFSRSHSSRSDLVKSSPDVRPKSSVMLASVVMLVAGCLLISTLGLVSTGPGPAITIVEQSPQETTSTAARMVAGISEDQVDLEAMAEYGKSYGEWFQGTAQKLSGTVSLVISEGEANYVQPTANWFSSLSEQLKTLDQELGATLKLVVPDSKPESNDQSSLPRFKGLRLTEFAV